MQHHPIARVARELRTPDGNACVLGYRMPAEWEPIGRVLVCHPHNLLTWPGCLDLACQEFHDMVQTLRRFVDVSSTQELGVTTDDSWIRDYGPIFVVTDDTSQPRLACHDFIFNCWGQKYEDYRQDDVVPQYVAAELEIPIWIHDVVLEGGAIDVNGNGTVMTTEQCLLNVNRNAHLSRQQIETILHQALGTTHVIWLAGGIAGDDTDGHVDDVARFIGPDVVVAVRAAVDHPDHEVLEMNWQVLEGACDQCGHDLNLLELPAPDPIFYEFPEMAGSGDPVAAGRKRLPASYANFLFANEGVLVPTFGQAVDDVALRVLERALPEHHITPVRSEHLIVGLGAIHCLSTQQPA